ncbi:MAG: universal stress protein [Hylemonella sp.]|nr:universal stress protein [Hylemonella sp.]
MKILVPVDGSEISLDAVRYAVRLQREGLRASVVLANVQEPASLYEMVVAHDIGVIERVSAEAGAHALAPAEALLREAGVSFESEVDRGDPAHTLVDILERHGCDLVVMGARGLGSMRSALLGSVSHEMLHAAGVAVMIVKSAAAD